jgi:hypothetical protein
MTYKVPIVLHKTVIQVLVRKYDQLLNIKLSMWYGGYSHLYGTVIEAYLIKSSVRL